MTEMNIKKFLDFLMSQSYPLSMRWNRIAYLLRDFVEAENVIEFYPQNLFNEEGNQLLAYVFKEDRVFKICSVEKEATIKVLNYQNIIKFDFRYFEESTVGFELKLNFNCGEEIKLNSNQDTKGHWETECRNKVETIYRYLANKS